MTQTPNERGSFVQYPCQLIYHCPILTRDDKWVLLALMGVCWDEAFHKLSYREIAALSGVPLSLLSSIQEKNGRPAREGIMDRLKRFDYIRCKMGKSINRSTGKPHGNAHTYISVNHKMIWGENAGYKISPCDAEEYQPVPNTNRAVPNTNSPVPNTNSPVLNARSNSHTYITIDNSDYLDKDTSVVAHADDTTLTIIFDIDDVPDFSHVAQLPVVRQWIDQSPFEQTSIELKPPQPVVPLPSVPPTFSSHNGVTPKTQPVRIEADSHTDVAPLDARNPGGDVTLPDTQHDAGSYSHNSTTNEQQNTPQAGTPAGPPKIPASEMPWNAEKLVQITEAKRIVRGKVGACFSTEVNEKSQKSQRQRQFAAAKKIIAAGVTEERYVTAYDERNDDWWNTTQGSLTVEHMAANTPRKVMRVLELLERLESVSDSIPGNRTRAEVKHLVHNGPQLSQQIPQYEALPRVPSDWRKQRRAAGGNG